MLATGFLFGLGFWIVYGVLKIVAAVVIMVLEETI